MNAEFVCCLKKDLLEYIKTKKNLLFTLPLLMLCIVVLCATLFLPSLVELLVERSSQTLVQPETISKTISSIFPSDLKANMGILSSDIAIFFGAIVILATYNLLSKEISDGKWIFAINAGYNPSILLISKGMIYGLGAAFSAWLFYNLYFIVGSFFLIPNYKQADAIANSFVLAYVIFSTVYLTIIISILLKQPLSAALTMILFISTAPDIFSLFSFGRYLPTYLLTYIYQSSTLISNLIIPVCLTVTLETILTVLSCRKIKNLEITR